MTRKIAVLISQFLRLPPFGRSAAEKPAPDTSRAVTPMTTAQQWSRLAGVLETAISGALEAGRRQAAATQQLDLAQYGLHTLGDELAAVMLVPGRRQPASLLQFEAPAAKLANSLAA